jgi:hypothetical protein
VPGLLWAYAWIVLHPGRVLAKRRALRAARRVPEREVTSWMTSDVANGDSPVARAFNACAHAYFRLTRIVTLEDLPPGTR